MGESIEKISHYYITRNSEIQGSEPVIKGTRFPVRSIVFYVLNEGMLPEELVREFLQLSLSAVYDALSYYYDHKEAIEKLMKEQRESIWKK